ncbi:hypothetical protein F5Y19DRAFT_478050 [Xylariaceae sp. FL1651]|nr:hypothetical protein F5Y19DRAFT_478050 [Xylariaceae sp. FL1651]
MDIKKPLRRLPRADILRPTSADLISLALLRMRHAAEPNNENPPPVVFPLAESMRWEFFSFDDWEEFGDLETEYGRLTYTLTRYPERGAPIACERTLRDLLQRSSVLTEWPRVASELQNHAVAALEGVCQKQQNRVLGRECTTKSDFVTVPVDYEVSKLASKMSLQLWNRSLNEIALELETGCLAHVGQFLQIHAFLKDPIFGFRTFKKQTVIFNQLFAAFQESVPAGSLKTGALERVAAQAAQESAYLVSPLLEKVSLVHFHAHHQLTYVDVRLDSLARAEWSVPSHVLEIAEEMLLAVASNEGLACPLVPILVTVRPSFSKDDQHLTPIVDGNHRATAALMLRFLASQAMSTDRVIMAQQLAVYCIDHGLGSKWHIDLMDVLDELFAERNRLFRDKLMSNASLVSKFATVEYIPALLVQEEDFHTICKQRSKGKPKPVLLHPFHQTLFNDDHLPFALPQKAGQTHGRPEAFRLLPLTPFGTTQSVDGAKVFEAKVRKSMNGLVEEELVANGNLRSGTELVKTAETHVSGVTTASFIVAGCCLGLFLLRRYSPRMLG